MPGPAGLAAVTKDGTHLLVLPVVQDLAEYVEVTGRDLAQEVAGDAFGPAADTGAREHLRRLGERLSTIKHHAGSAEIGPQQIREQRAAATAKVHDPPGSQRPEAGRGEFAHHGAGDPAHRPAEPHGFPGCFP